ncbi:MurR/RpiR family transcriptional regulator [Pseudoflavonifractor sp. DSM 107456]|uniref:MurR/RpiR family transcriptional regulator n=1 Tax=Pseudoflavonifractor gallinarum TaxID=2779352 RepID=A0ABR9R8G2_9FIRM|nr:MULTISPECIES: MurR/RpiR family transcriptional regulator [Eubacteriales]MBE5054911.1 MurR/RpiR family transcriptional regulator [Pseudoflavonifractor gallinarum]MBS5134603.1 MurR/RpiR family transcriptional regulator [Oscillospiraceae bacterium]
MELCLAISPGELTRAEQKILDYINTNTDAFLFSSIGQLARRLGLSDATVSRFARHVGCTDFKELKSLVVEQAAGPAAKMAGTLSQDGGFSPIAWLERQQLYLQKTAQQLDQVEFDRAADALVSARRIFLHGKNASSSLANMLAFRLRRLGLPVSLLPSGGSELLEGLLQAEEQDLVVMFSFSKLSREGRVILDHSKTVGYQTLAFVSRTCIPPEEQADISLFAYRGEEKEYHSMSAPTALLDVLTVAVTERLGQRGSDSLERLHQLKTSYFPLG